MSAVVWQAYFSFPYSEFLQELLLMLTKEEQPELLAAERSQFPGDAELGRVDTKKATILGQAWVMLRRAEIQRDISA